MILSPTKQELCLRGAQLLQSKSINVEDAANELINMLCIVPDDDDEDEAQGEEQDEGQQRQPSPTPSGRKTGKSF